MAFGNVVLLGKDQSPVMESVQWPVAELQHCTASNVDVPVLSRIIIPLVTKAPRKNSQSTIFRNDHDPLPASHVLVQLKITLQHLQDWNKRMIVMNEAGV